MKIRAPRREGLGMLFSTASHPPPTEKNRNGDECKRYSNRRNSKMLTWHPPKVFEKCGDTTTDREPSKKPGHTWEELWKCSVDRVDRTPEPNYGNYSERELPVAGTTASESVRCKQKQAKYDLFC